MTDVMDPQPNQPKKSDLLVRSLSAIVLGPLVLGAVYLGTPYSDILICIAGLILAWEWASLCGHGLIGRSGGVLIVSIALTLILAILGYGMSLIGFIPFAAVVLYFVSLFEYKDSSKSLWYSTGAVYLSICSFALLWLRNIPDNGLEIIFWILFVVWATDIGAYFAGRSIGGPKIAPKISPKKTWSGLVGGMISAAVVSYISAFWFVSWEPGILVLYGALLAVVSQAGDFFESHLKRRFDAKDASNLIPGHGGLLDRVDGLLACSFFVFVFQFL